MLILYYGSTSIAVVTRFSHLIGIHDADQSAYGTWMYNWCVFSYRKQLGVSHRIIWYDRASAFFYLLVYFVYHTTIHTRYQVGTLGAIKDSKWGAIIRYSCMKLHFVQHVSRPTVMLMLRTQKLQKRAEKASHKAQHVVGLNDPVMPCSLFAPSKRWPNYYSSRTAVQNVLDTFITSYVWFVFSYIPSK